MSDRGDPATLRYERLYREMRQGTLRPLVACWVTTIFLAVVLVAIGDPVVQWALENTSLPAVVVVVGWLGLFIAAVVVIPSLAQLAVLGRNRASAYEVMNGWAIEEQRRFRAKTGKPLPRLRDQTAARRWLAAADPSHLTPSHVRVLIWTGDFSGARAAVEAINPDAGSDRFQKALLNSLIVFVERGISDFRGAQDLVREVEPEDRDYAQAAIAQEYARAAAARGEDWSRPLATARTSLSRLPAGASMRDRFIRGNVPLAAMATMGAILGVLTSR